MFRRDGGRPGRAMSCTRVTWRPGTPHGRDGARTPRCPAPAMPGGGRCTSDGRRGQARPAVFCVLRETESMTTAASSTPPVIMYWIRLAMPSRFRPVLDRLDDQHAEQRGPDPAASAEEAGAADDGRGDDVHQQCRRHRRSGWRATVEARDEQTADGREACPRSRRREIRTAVTLMPARRDASTLPPSAKILRPYVVRRSTKSAMTSTARKSTRASGRPRYWLSTIRGGEGDAPRARRCARTISLSGRDGSRAASRRRLSSSSEPT